MKCKYCGGDVVTSINQRRTKNIDCHKRCRQAAKGAKGNGMIMPGQVVTRNLEIKEL